MNTTPIKCLMLYINPAWRRKGMHTPILNPWWGNVLNDSSLFTKRVFDTYSFDTTYYRITDNIQEAEVVLLPYPYGWLLKNNKALLRECVDISEKASLPILIDGLKDIESHIPIQNSYVLRYGGYRFMKERGRIQIPLFADDLLERFKKGQSAVRKKENKRPVIGFAGWAHISKTQSLRTMIKEMPLRVRGMSDKRYRACIKGIFWRKKTIRVLQNSPLVILRAHIRRSFSGTAKTAEGNMEMLQQEMANNIWESDYALDVRGDANNSARLFEILSLGRIPVIVDTERNFPFSDKIDYSSFSFIVDFRDIEKLPERISKFHESISAERFEEMQRNAREAYINYFRIDAMTRYMVAGIRDQILR